MSNQSLEVQQKKEVVTKGEKTVPARFYVPGTDIYETEEALQVVMEVPGVDRKNIDVKLENDELHVEARIDFSNYEGMEPLYTEYNVGHFARSFSLSQQIDQNNIAANLSDGVLTLTLKKIQQAQPRRIEIR
ncbi:MAG TPA: Hsp20/alpha crystallin family protein [Reyranella sp.]|nr:Hsp20/alpha crystallin family protein [Reyranella sp.]